MSGGGPDVDVVVVGAGPVGLATAIGAADAGLSVLLADPRGPETDKACGEGLMPSARAGLADLGVDLLPGRDGAEIHGIRYLSPGHAAVARFRAGPGLGVRRTVLSRALHERATALGVERVRARAEVPAQGGAGARGWVDVAGVRARWCVAADGLHSPLRRGLGLDDPGVSDGQARALARYGQRRHYRIAPWGELVDVLWSEHAEAYVTPVAPDTVGVAVLSSRRAGFDELLAQFPGLAARLAGVPHASTTRGAGPLRQRAVRHHVGRVLLVGDAAGYVDALTGEGIAVGLASARAAVRAVVADDASGYERDWARGSRRYRLLTEGLLLASSRPAPRRLLVPAAQRLPRVFSAVVEQLA